MLIRVFRKIKFVTFVGLSFGLAPLPESIAHCLHFFLRPLYPVSHAPQFCLCYRYYQTPEEDIKRSYAFLVSLRAPTVSPQNKFGWEIRSAQ